MSHRNDIFWKNTGTSLGMHQLGDNETFDMNSGSVVPHYIEATGANSIVKLYYGSQYERIFFNTHIYGITLQNDVGTINGYSGSVVFPAGCIMSGQIIYGNQWKVWLLHKESQTLTTSANLQVGLNILNPADDSQSFALPSPNGMEDIEVEVYMKAAHSATITGTIDGTTTDSISGARSSKRYKAYGGTWYLVS